MSTSSNGASAHEQLRKWRRTDDVDGLRRRVHRAIRAAEVILYSEQASIDQRLKACTVIQQTARTHLALIEADELEQRVKVLEQQNTRIERALSRTNGYHVSETPHQ